MSRGGRVAPSARHAATSRRQRTASVAQQVHARTYCSTIRWRQVKSASRNRETSSRSMRHRDTVEPERSSVPFVESRLQPALRTMQAGLDVVLGHPITVTLRRESHRVAPGQRQTMPPRWFVTTRRVRPAVWTPSNLRGSSRLSFLCACYPCGSGLMRRPSRVMSHPSPRFRSSVSYTDSLPRAFDTAVAPTAATRSGNAMG
jgi:hypothetical protein